MSLILLNGLNTQFLQLLIIAHPVNQPPVVLFSDLPVLLRFAVKLGLFLLGGGETVLETEKLLGDTFALEEMLWEERKWKENKTKTKSKTKKLILKKKHKRLLGSRWIGQSSLGILRWGNERTSFCIRSRKPHLKKIKRK